MCRRSIGITLALLTVAALLPPAAAQENTTPLMREGLAGLALPPATEEGVWDGSWAYVSRDYRIAMWMRTIDERAEVKLQIFNTNSLEAFETDWNGVADYSARDGEGRFAFTLEQAGANRIEADWNWVLEFPLSSRTETAKVTIFRVANGRGLVMSFDGWNQTIRRPTGVERREAAQAWTFRKVSKRLVRWDEFPF